MSGSDLLMLHSPSIQRLDVHTHTYTHNDVCVCVCVLLFFSTLSIFRRDPAGLPFVDNNSQQNK